jgi:hypothetical protein
LTSEPEHVVFVFKVVRLNFVVDLLELLKYILLILTQLFDGLVLVWKHIANCLLLLVYRQELWFSLNYMVRVKAVVVHSDGVHLVFFEVQFRILLCFECFVANRARC